jgi:uncharacterized protein (TIGR00299 family) protein
MTQPVLWIDASRGIAGDMLLAALLDAGADLNAVRAAMTATATATGEAIGIEVESVRRHGLRASHLIVTVPPSSVRRHLDDVLTLIAAAGLSEPAATFAEQTFRRLAEAEGQVHGKPAASVHFHEVGALDSIADIIGCAVALDSLGLLAPDAVRVASVIALGGGSARTEHGVIPVPVPAVLELLRGYPVSAGAGDRELCTPTGAALVAALATGTGSLPALSIRSTGTGAGGYDPADRPNVTRVVIGDRAVEAAGWQQQDLMMLEATVDDLDPRLWPAVLDALHQAGAADAWLTPILMRHGRPGQVVTALLAPESLDAGFAALAGLGVTLGARTYGVQRRSLPRDSVTVEVGGQPIQVKRGFLDGRPVSVQPEFTDAAAAAAASGIALPEVLDRARQQARERPSDDVV